jgi:hypothetical protein
MKKIIFSPRRLATTIGIAAALAVAACGEIPQEGPKPYAGKEDTKPYAGDLFKGDKAKYEKTLAERANYQNENSRATWK